LRGVDGFYEIAVTDTGVGISDDFLPFVFDRFRQADGSLTLEHGGLGLGLAIVKELTSLHGGTVDVESAGLNRGATFRVRIPALIEGPSPVAGSETTAPDGAALRGVRLLAVDDNADTLELLEIGLTAAGAHVRTASAAAAALELFDREAPDVLLCDLAMPEIDGFALLQRLRQRGHLLPAIALSAHASADHRERSRRAGFREHVAKPFRIETVIQAIHASLRSPASPPRPDSPSGGAGQQTG
jgi:CheY-like chemotaxis protein